MGALTDHRKRLFADLCSPLPSSASPLKKSKLAGPQNSEETPIKPHFRRIPCLRRPLHGPQRILRAFGRASSSRFTPNSSPPRERESSMGNAVSSWFAKWATPPPEPPWSSRKQANPSETHEKFGLKIGTFEELDLIEYKKLVSSAKDEKPPFNIAFPPPFAIIGEELEATESPPSIRNAESAATLPKRTPLYKDLLASARRRDDKISSLEFEVKLTEKKILEFHQVPSDKKKDLSAPFTPLTDEEENAVRLALCDPDEFWSNKHEVLVVHEGSNIEITREVIQCLRLCSWLNDEVINLYFELLKERERREPDKFLRCHFFNTFFYKKLTGGKNGYDFKAVRRWTSQRKLGYGLIECDKIFVPIHKEIHWCLAVIDMKDRKFIYLDSLGGMDDYPLHVLARYIVDEVKDKNDEVIDVASWEHGTVDKLPLQENGWDCGMFMVKYVDFFSRGLTLHFRQDDMDYFRRRTVNEILNLRAE